MIIRPRVSQSLQRQLSLVPNIFIRANASKCTPFISTISFTDSVPLLQVDGSKVDLDIRSSRSTTSLGLWTDLTRPADGLILTTDQDCLFGHFAFSFMNSSNQPADKKSPTESIHFLTNRVYEGYALKENVHETCLGKSCGICRNSMTWAWHSVLQSGDRIKHQPY